MNPLRIALLGVALLAAPALAEGEPWGADINDGDGPKLIAVAAPHLHKIVKASDADRPALVTAYATGLAGDHIEAVKRFRNPELKPLFLALLKHDDWKVRHRALFALESYGGADVFSAALLQLEHEAPRLREKAAITCLRTWNDAGAKGVDWSKYHAGADAKRDPHVAVCIDTLVLRAKGKLPVRQVYKEVVVKRPDGLQITPFLSGMNNVKALAPGYKPKGVSESGGGSASKVATGPWTTPLMLYGQEVRTGTSLQPFANLRGGGKTYHTGQDIGACMDGAGYYAAAPGVVKLVHSGSDMGTLLVVQHNLGDKRVVNAVYMHGGSTVFVKGGQRVESGQLLGTMGMSYSIENGGHYAHLHYGLYPGSFSMTHNYGYRGVTIGLIDWYDPAHYLPVWRELTAPLVALDRSPTALGAAAKALASGKLGAAYVAAATLGAPGEKLRTELETAVASAPKRAERMRDLGYPARAIGFLASHAKSCKGIPGAETLGTTAKTWKTDATFKAGLAAEKKVLAAESSALDLIGKPAEAKAMWDGLLEKYGDTCVAPRIRALSTGVGLR